MRLRRKTASATSLALIAVIVIAAFLGVYFSLNLKANTTTSEQAARSTPASITTESASVRNCSKTTYDTESTVIETPTTTAITTVTGPTITGHSSSSVSSTSYSVSSTSTITYSAESMVGTGTSIPGWEFLVRIVITGSDATVSSNLTYTGSQNGTIEIGYPVALTEVKNVNGDVIWSTISTALLRIVNVTYGQSFTSTDNVSGVLQAGSSYTFDVWPQIHAQSGEFIGNQLQLVFAITIPGATQTSSITSATQTSCTYTITQEATTYMTASDQTVTQSYYVQTITTIC